MHQGIFTLLGWIHIALHWDDVKKNSISSLCDISGYSLSQQLAFIPNHQLKSPKLFKKNNNKIRTQMQWDLMRIRTSQSKEVIIFYVLVVDLSVAVNLQAPSHDAG